MRGGLAALERTYLCVVYSFIHHAKLRALVTLICKESSSARVSIFQKGCTHGMILIVNETVAYRRMKEYNIPLERLQLRSPRYSLQKHLGVGMDTFDP